MLFFVNICAFIEIVLLFVVFLCNLLKERNFFGFVYVVFETVFSRNTDAVNQECIALYFSSETLKRLSPCPRIFLET